MTERASLLPLRVAGLRLGYGRARVLDDVSFDLGRRGCTVVMGPNGAGKSQMLRALHGLVTPDAGVIDWNGVGAQAATARQALVFQKPVLLRRSVVANIDFILRARGLDRSAALPLLTRVGLADKAHQPARRLSGGEAQRLALARALATEPEVLLMDEATASLDPASTAAIEAIVLAARDAGTRILFVTHDIGQARRVADDVLFLHRGRLREHRPAPDFFDNPQSPEARDFLAGRLVT